MQTHHFTLTITASAVAWYAAITSTVIACVQAANYFRDRARVKVQFQRNREIFGDPRRAGMIFTMVTVTNTGRRPVTITNVGMMYLQNRGAVFTDITPRVPPCELTEGQYLTVLIDEQLMPFDRIRSFEAYDSVGRTFRQNYAPWWRRLWWYFRRKFGKA